MKYAALLIGLFLVTSSLSFAQVTNPTFNIRVFGSEDTQAPTTPVLLSATPVAYSQIDLDWSASTDNFAVSGYTVTRGTTTIATTTLTNYSDTSVSAATTYTYSIQAFDANGNYSSSSNAIATTTPAVPVVSPPAIAAGATEGTSARVVVDDFRIVSGVSTTSLYIQTARPSLMSLRWGRTTSYELGFLVNETYSNSHEIQVTDLEPGTTYEFELTARTPSGLMQVIKTGQFTTLPSGVQLLPSNVARFTAEAVGTDVNLSWQRPVDESIAYVRIVRSHLRFPTHPQDGAVVYQGLAGTASDKGVLQQFSPVYYTAFTYDTAGRISSGAVSIVYASESDPAQPSGLEAQPELGQPLPGEEATSTIDETTFTPDMKVPTLSQITIVQNGREFTFDTTPLELKNNQQFIISLDADTVAGNLKTIIATVIDPTNNKQRYSFLLRINSDQTAYEAVMPALFVVGKSKIVLQIFDYEAAVVATYQTPVTFVDGSSAAGSVLFPDVIMGSTGWFLYGGVIALMVAFLLYLLYRRRTEDNRL